MYTSLPQIYKKPSLTYLKQSADATTNAHIITIGPPMTAPTVETINPMSFPRIFANGVVLPTGAVLITGGQSYGIPFSDNGSSLQPELWDPVSTNFTPVAPLSIPRNYHSVAILLPDATVLSAGGGLCGACAGNHFDGQIYSPAYLFDATGARATRPVIVSANATVAVGGTLMATTDSAVTSWALLRLDATTRTSPLPTTPTKYLQIILSPFLSNHANPHPHSQINRHRPHGPAPHPSECNRRRRR